jgi:hypothetical protein
MGKWLRSRALSGLLMEDVLIHLESVYPHF